MKCEGCQAPLTNFNTLPLQISCGSPIVKCPVCNFVTQLCYNRRRQIWESLAEHYERRKGWKKQKHVIDRELLRVATSYREEKQL